MEFGTKIKALRNKRGITQEALAKTMGVTPQTVSKWENDVTMPDVALLPELSVFFGVTIDELFSLNAKKQMERIENRIYEAGLLSETEATQMEETLREFAKTPEDKAQALSLISEIHLHQAEIHKRMGAELAKEALELEPDNSSYLSDYCTAMESYIPDWNCRNHHILIQELQDFVKRHPDNRAASMWLLDNLMADKRLKEAEPELAHLAQIDTSYRPVLYRALFAAAKGDKELEAQCYQEIEENFTEGKDAWVVQLSLAERETERQNYEKAIEHYERAMEVQASPKFTDAPEAMAHIYEILGDKEKAVECYKLRIKMMREEWGIIAGDDVDQINRSIQKLLEK